MFAYLMSIPHITSQNVIGIANTAPMQEVNI